MYDVICTYTQTMNIRTKLSGRISVPPDIQVDFRAVISVTFAGANIQVDIRAVYLHEDVMHFLRAVYCEHPWFHSV